MDIGEHEEYPKGDIVLLCGVKGCNRRAVGRIGNKRLCDLHMGETLICVDCNRFSLGKAGEIPDNYKLDGDIEFLRNRKVKICIKCGRVYGEHGEELTKAGKKIYFRNERFVLES